jgi:pantoate--beta-alanine ligase
MRMVRSVANMQRSARRWRRAGIRVGFVPTMGFLHDGHLSLMRRARRLVGPKGQVVVSIYVNPTQFGQNEDFSKYPRDLARDQALCRSAGVDVLFTPDDQEMYPSESGQIFSTFVVEEALSRGMEGAARPTHFRGVTTIVAKLLNMVLPEIAVFGEKDFQQSAVVRRMVHDLNFPVRIVVGPTERETDGLAMSSRNKYLSAEERPQARVLGQAIRLAKETVRTTRRPVSAARLRAKLIQLIKRQPAARVDYIAFFHPATLQPVTQVSPGTRLAMAVFIGRTRLIDNAGL